VRVLGQLPLFTDVCHVCGYPTTNGRCLNPVCGGTPEAEARFAAAKVARDAAERENAERHRLFRKSFGG
jgi:hypothetical protein